MVLILWMRNSNEKVRPGALIQKRETDRDKDREAEQETERWRYTKRETHTETEIQRGHQLASSLYPYSFCRKFCSTRWCHPYSGCISGPQLKIPGNPLTDMWLCLLVDSIASQMDKTNGYSQYFVLKHNKTHPSDLWLKISINDPYIQSS
jgi:hypothetical protein